MVIAARGQLDAATVGRRSLRPREATSWSADSEDRLDALGPAPRAELLRALMLPNFERADRITSRGIETGDAHYSKRPASTS